MALRAGEADRQLSAWSLEIQRLFLLKTLSKVAKEGNVLNLIKGICVNLRPPPPFTVGDLMPHHQKQGRNVLSHRSCSNWRPQAGNRAGTGVRSGRRRRMSVHRQDLLCRQCAGALTEATGTEKRVQRSRRYNAHCSPRALAPAGSSLRSLALSCCQPAARRCSPLWHSHLVINYAALVSFILTFSGF